MAVTVFYTVREFEGHVTFTSFVIDTQYFSND